ncbi:MAG TPA: hypothetical protein VHY48_04685 [Acidobacteriaceae bacterium]|jgi:hypothetical protein|nr:hypothetical protein [Acidobacteriaceae bacterium]
MWSEVPMTMEPSGTGRMVLSLAVIALLALAVWLTMEPGKFEYFTWVVLGFFASRVVLLRLRARYSESGAPVERKQEG